METINVNGYPVQICQLDSEGRIISLSSGEEGSAGSLSVAEVAGGADDPDLVLTLQDAAEAVTAAEEADKKLASSATGITQEIFQTAAGQIEMTYEDVEAGTIFTANQFQKHFEATPTASAATRPFYKNAFVRITNSNLSNEATQLILNHYTMYRSDHPNKSHEAASSETARILGVTLTAVRRALRECASYTDLETSRIKSAVRDPGEIKDEMDASDGTPHLVTEIRTSKECTSLVDERVVIGLAKAIKMAVAVHEPPLAGGGSIASTKLYRPPSCKKKQLVTVSNHGSSYKKVDNNEELLTRWGASELSGSAGVDSELSCDVCAKTFKKAQALKSHKRCHISKFCRYCGKEFQTKAQGKTSGQRASSMVVFHEIKCIQNPNFDPSQPKPKQKVKCNVCKKAFKFYTSLVRHKKQCTEDNPKKAKRVRGSNGPTYQEKINALKAKNVDSAFDLMNY